jgi:hypothetical protein
MQICGLFKKSSGAEGRSRAGCGESAALQARRIQPRVRMARTIVRPIAKVNNFLGSLVIEITLGLVSAILVAGCALIGKLEK